ncbi:nucleotide sugar dehydrogenase [Paramicrobacterium chengjingii]|uniref:Nucleotide sugar dehydrogenase n=1 Tax=Paramicrobacterium chengjingii TaxID=2769067 RepID=A0ABX6YFB3_9MICO|nr:nucleotide sugar dehydrogenase [Microbacterium chengjingii]QPZ37484.1 nucleotide sugar dehydrogenase [Microbacterium chengjingii]
MQTQKVVIVGQGYVGLPVAMRAVAQGYDVVGLDLNQLRVSQLSNGISYVEDVSEAELRTALETGRFHPSSRYEDAQDFDFAVISVPTPLNESIPDLSFIESAGESLAPHVRSESTVILESTTYPGTTEELLVPVLEQGSGLKAGRDFSVGYSPERIDPGNAIWNFQNTPKVVSGVDERSTERVIRFYKSLVDVVVPVKSPREAELTKLLENTFRHVNVALVNELAMFGHQLGVDVWNAIEAAGTKPFGFMKFTPGAGVGGHCLPVDPSYLLWEVRRKLGKGFRFVELANDINDHMPDYVVQRLMIGMNERSKALRGSKILLLGLSYKAGTGDIRESPSMKVMTALKELGADVYALDPFVDEAIWPTTAKRVESTRQVGDIDAAILLVDHPNVDYSGLNEAECYVLDVRNRISGENVEHL